MQRKHLFWMAADSAHLKFHPLEKLWSEDIFLVTQHFTDVLLSAQQSFLFNLEMHLLK